MVQKRSNQFANWPDLFHAQLFWKFCERNKIASQPMPEYNISILNIFLWSSKGFYFLCSLYAVSKNYMYFTCSFDETTRSFSSCTKTTYQKCIDVWSFSGEKHPIFGSRFNQKEIELHYIKDARFSAKSQHASPFWLNEGSTVSLNYRCLDEIHLRWSV